MTYNGKLTSLSHGGGCGCKIAPGILSDILKSTPVRIIPPELLAEEAIEMMEKYRINHLVVADNNGTLLGALNLHDLFAAKVI